MHSIYLKSVHSFGLPATPAQNLQTSIMTARSSWFRWRKIICSTSGDSNVSIGINLNKSEITSSTDRVDHMPL